MQRSNRVACDESKSEMGQFAQEAAKAILALDVDYNPNPADSQDRATIDESAVTTWDTPPLNFPSRLMQILQLDDPPGGIYWLPDGKRFAVNVEMIEDVLVTYFQGAKWLSFTRTLNKW